MKSSRRAPVLRCGTIGLITLFVAGFAACATPADRSELATEYYNLGNAFFELGDFDRSAEYYSRALDLDETLARASFNLARVYVVQNRFDDAIEILGQLRLQDPANTIVLETLGYAHFSLGQEIPARETYLQVLTIDPGNVNVLYNLAQIELAAGNDAVALDYLDRATQLDPGDTEVLALLASTATAAGDEERALVSLEQLLDSGNAPPQSLLDLAGIYESNERYDRALEVLDIVTQTEDTGLAAQADFRKAAILLTAAQESEAGLAALEAALTRGFSDAEAIAGLLDNSDIISRTQVETLLESYGLFGSGEGEETDSGEPPEEGPPVSDEG